MTALWEYDEFGEPWLENGRRGNPPLLIVNRKPHKKGKKRMARTRYARRKTRSNRVHHRGRKRNARRRTRRNPWPMAGPVAMVNRKRRRSNRRGRKRSNPHRKHYRRNPGILGISLPPLQSVLYAGVGFVGVPLAEGFLTRFLPVSLTGSTVGKYATRIAAMLGLSYLTKIVLGSSESKMVAIGGGAYVLTSAVTEFAPGLIPATNLSAYRPATLGAYATSTRRQLGSMGAPDWGAKNTVRSAPMGAANIVSSRFRRFQ